MVYEYTCRKCQWEGDLMIDGYGGDPGPCPDCAAILTKVIRTAPPIFFRGEGWWATEHGTQRYNCLGRVPDDIDDPDFGDDEDYDPERPEEE